MKQHINAKNTCPGRKSLISEDPRSLGGHMEDYITDPTDKTPISHTLRWVPVSDSFKKK